MRSAARVVLLISAVLVVGVLPVGTGHTSEIFTVTLFGDPPPGDCLPGDCSLREAVIDANATAGADVILVPAGTYSLTRSGVGQSNGDLDILEDVSISKIGGGNVALVDGHGTLTGDRVFEIFAGVDAVFQQVSVRNGLAPQEGAADDPRHGGGIRINSGGSLQLIGGAVTGNTAPNTASAGGGIYNQGELTLTKVNVQINEIDFGFGGGIFTTATGTTTVDRSVVRDNTAAFGGGFASSGGTVVITNSLVRGNTAGLGGAGYLSGGAGATIENSTVAGNISADRGGAFRVRNAALHLESSTLSDNEAEFDGGGIAVQDDAGPPSTVVSLKNSIVAQNVDHQGGDRPDCYDQTGGLVTSLGGNVVGNQTGCVIGAVGTDDIGSGAAPLDAGLKPLAFNGGPLKTSLTFALKPVSLARNNASGCDPKDQRGTPRQLGGACDSGAYEEAFCNGVLVNRVGTPGADKANNPVFKGTAAADGFIGLGGNDSFKGGGGNDGICGGPGGDTLTGGGGNDTISGGPGPDKLIGGTGTDTCKGGSGTDSATGCENKTGIP